MKSILFLLICLFFIHLSSAGIRKKCNKSFTDYKMQQFTETVSRYFSTDKNKPIVFGNSEFKSPSAKRTGSHGTGIPNGSITNGKGQNPIQPIIDKLVSEKKDRKGILRYLVAMGYLKIENTTTLNPLFDYILSRPLSEIVRLIKEKPSFLYEGTLMGLSPFFLMVFIGNKQAMEAAIEIDKTLVHSRNALEETPLHYTIDPEIATKLLYYNARPDAQDKTGYVSLHHMRKLETIETMLYYKADSSIRDRSGVSLVKYHETFVGDPEIIALFHQARENQRSVKDNHVSEILLEESREEHQNSQASISNIKREEPKPAAPKTENQNTVTEEIKKAQKIKEAIKVRQKRAAEHRDTLIAHIADGISAILIRRMFANRPAIIRYITNQHIGIYVDGSSLVQKKHLSNLVILNRDLEQEFEVKITQAYRETKHIQDSNELHRERFLDEVKNIVNELAERLETELQDTSLKALKRMVNKVERVLLKVEKTERRLSQQNSQPPALGNLIRFSIMERRNM